LPPTAQEIEDIAEEEAGEKAFAKPTVAGQTDSPNHNPVAAARDNSLPLEPEPENSRSDSLELLMGAQMVATRLATTRIQEAGRSSPHCAMVPKPREPDSTTERQTLPMAERTDLIEQLETVRTTLSQMKDNDKSIRDEVINLARNCPAGPQASRSHRYTRSDPSTARTHKSQSTSSVIPPPGSV